MRCETLARKVFQCERYGDALGGSLTNASRWDDLLDDEFSEAGRCKAWSVLARLQGSYLEDKRGREALLRQTEKIEDRVLTADSNQALRDAMIEMMDIASQLNLKEFPHLNHAPSNDQF